MITEFRNYVLLCVLFFFLPTAAQSAPKNIAELFQGDSFLFSIILLAGFTVLFLGAARILGNVILDKQKAAYIAPLWLLLFLSLNWILLRDAVPAESLHDILGSPVKNWLWEWEYLYRFTALFAWFIMCFTTSVLIAESVLANKKPSRTSLLAYCSLFIACFCYFHYVTVIDAATDNLTELMEDNGSIQTSLYLTLGFIFAGLGAAAINSSRSRDHGIASIILLIIFSFMFSSLFIWLGAENNVEKYGQSFHALQFLILGDRSLDLSIFHILILYTALYIALNMIMLGCFKLMNLLQVKAQPRLGQQNVLVKLPQNRDFWLFSAYTAFIFYGTLFSTTEWVKSSDFTFSNILSIWQNDLSPLDILVNLAVYVPLGYFLARYLLTTYSRTATLFYCILTSLLCSVSLEVLQLVIPNRVSSILDIFLNTASGFIGALLAIKLKSNLQNLNGWHRFGPEFQHSKPHQLGLITIFCWLLFEAAPLIPGLYISNLIDGIKPVWLFFQGQNSFSYLSFAAYYLTFLFILYFGRTLFREKNNRFILLVFSCLIAAKILVIGQQLDIEILFASALAFVSYYPTKNLIKPSHTILLIALAASGFILREFVPGSISTTTSFNLIPFYFQLSNPKSMLTALFQSWVVLAILNLLLIRNPVIIRNTSVMYLGAFLIFVTTVGINLIKHNIEGRHGDITDAILFVIAWFIAWHFISSRSQASQYSNKKEAIQGANKRSPALIILITFILLPFLSVNWVSGLEVGSQLTKAQNTNTFPEASELARPTLDSFKLTHPRLPSPAHDELALLREKNPQYIAIKKHAAKKKQPDLQAIVFLEMLEPGSQDLQRLFQQLMALEFSSRGNVQVKPLSMAFDWLYFSWTETQRLALTEKLAQGCHYEIDYIRKAKLSPYNVFLYNSPLQALMACSIALYNEHPDAEDIMAFTYELWINRVLPVWRQIMGENGGWHEGGEYVGIGIGQAVYQLPSMWRKATGEDLFKTEPGIKGFLDFLIYRTRPDGTHMRWGDAGFFDKKVPDQLALALEFNHHQAYQLANPPKNPTPTSWPWGPLTLDKKQMSETSLAPLPSVKFFDGIGMIVARNNWKTDATYLTFKAGDNYWSHSHLDQGAFTLYKGGPLAIDSGVYGPKYGSDHHLNYSYQTIAHNTITVTDPEDNLPLPVKKQQDKPRPIANDGGQRRVGSGWGLPAPIDLKEWNEQIDTYHTALMKEIQFKDNLLLATADLTPAYTNKKSGKKLFRDRTKRVDSAFRSIGYDLDDDVVVIFDNIDSTNANFRKKWLLHTVEEPIINKNSFSTFVTPSAENNQLGGRLDGKILYPKNAYVQSIGGKNFEFFIDNKNYNENYTLEKFMKKRRQPSEPGNWRVEIIPSDPSINDIFLVVLLPSISMNKPAHKISLTNDGRRIGCLVKGPKRTTQWWFDPVSNEANVEIVNTSKL